MVEPNTTNTVIHGERNIAIKIATWLPKVYDAGGITILNGIIIGTTIAIAVSKAVNVKNLFFFIEYIPFSTVYTVVYTTTLQISMFFYENERIFS